MCPEPQPLHEGTDLDGAVIANLKRMGSDLSKPHPLEFYLFFAEQASAELAAATIRSKDFDADVSDRPGSNLWVVHLTKSIVPNLATLHQLRREFADLAVSLDGEYDGWETGVVK